MKVVLDTNAVLVSVSSRSPFHWLELVWDLPPEANPKQALKAKIKIYSEAFFNGFATSF